jgi:hypothetical protein
MTTGTNHLVAVLSLIILLFGPRSAGFSQEQPAGKDTAVAMPRLEIPEITIVGKKAITLPFARKGEIFDVRVYEAPPPDTSLIGDRQTMAIPIGALSRYEEHQQPWRASLEGALGSFSTGKVLGYLDYKTQRWGIYGNGGFNTTQGHTQNSAGSSGRLEVNAHSLVSTDNEFLKTFRTSGGVTIAQESYGMFGIPGADVHRRRNNVDLRGQVGSVDRRGNVIDLNLAANIWSITDTRSGIDSNVSVVSPDLRARVGFDPGNVNLSSEFFYSGSSLNYQHPSQSPSVLGVNASARWQLADKLVIHAGAIYHRGSDNTGQSQSLLAPTAIVQWEADQDREWSFWFEPEIHLMTYDEHVQENPYFTREIAIRPERKPVRFGTTLVYKDRVLSATLSGAFTHSTNRNVTVADSSGRITLEGVAADQFTAQADGTLYASTGARIKFSGVFQPGHEIGTSVQLPMVPIVRVLGRGELDLHSPVTLWSSVEYWSRRHIDRAGTNSLGDVVLVGAGVSTDAIPRTVLSFEIANLFNTSYRWWNGYVAPGRQLTLDARVNLR